MLKRFIKIGSAAIAAFNVAIAGAGPDVNSGEFFNQPYLQGLGVVPAWQAGLLGGGIVVANLDSGIRDTHVDLVGTIVPGGYDFVNDDDDPFDDELSLTYGHGTASAGIIVGNWNGVGVGGIAPNAKILPVKITNDQNLTDGGLISQGVLYAAARPEVRIILLEAVGPSTSPAEFAALGTAVANGKLVIAPAGNQGQASPANPASNFGSLGSSALVVGSNNGAGGRSVFSNGAAGVENNYITAHGEYITAAGNQGDDFYYRVDGTSMAAPQVAAAAALIWAYSPGLTAGQVAEILKKSATDLGSPGIDSIFGAGALNIEKALAPIGAIVAPVEEESDPDDEESSNGSTDPDAAEPDESGNADDGDSSKSSSGNGAGAGLALAALVVGGVGYALVRNNPDLGETLVLDEYGRTYELDLETRIGVRNSGPSAKSVLQELDADQVQETLIQRSDLTLTATYTMDASTQPFSGSPEASSSEIDRPVGVGFRASESDGTQYAFGINQSISSFASDPLGGGTTTSLTGAFQSDAFATPFFGYTNLGYHGAVAIAPDVGWQAGLAFAAVDDQTRHGVKSDASSLQFGFRDKRYGLSVQLGLLEEDGNLLGGASDGALSVSRAQTLFSTARGNFNLNGNWSIVGQYSHGMTWAEDQATSLVRDFSQIESNSWGLGLLGRNLSRSGDAFGIAVSQPLRTINGDARVSTPYWNRKTGGIDFKNRRTSLIPDGTETSIEFFYRRPVGKQIRLISYFVYREQPLHQAKSKSEMSLIGAVSWDFGVR